MEEETVKSVCVCMCVCVEPRVVWRDRQGCVCGCVHVETLIFLCVERLVYLYVSGNENVGGKALLNSRQSYLCDSEECGRFYHSLLRLLGR